MGTEPQKADPVDSEHDRFLFRLSHRGRVIRVGLALVLTAAGMVPVPYIGWGYGLVLCGPAAALMFHAGLERKTRRVVCFWAIPTIVGVALGLFSVAAYALGGGVSRVLSLQVLGLACLTTLAAAVLGRPPTA
jgi:hypothetical protein